MDIIFFLIIILILVWFQSYFFNKYAFNKLSYKCYFSLQKSRQGGSLEFIEEIYNNKFLPIPWLKVNICTSKWLEFADSHSTIAQDSRYITSGYFLKGYQKTIRRWNVTCIKRGFFETTAVTLVSGDLFGMNLSSKAYPTKASLIVYPSGIPVETFFLSKNTLLGNTIIKRWIHEDPFFAAGARNYTSSDSINKIHWTATARQQKLMVRKNDYTTSPSLITILNIQSLDNENDLVVHKDMIEYGINIVAGIIERSSQISSPLGFLSNSYIENKNTPIVIEKSFGNEHLYKILEVLAKLRLSNSQEFSVFLKSKVSFFRNEDIFIITSYLTENIVEVLYEIAKQNNNISIIYLGNFKVNVPLPKGVSLIYG